ncbi:MAG: nuclear transport factor 2 family protein [Halioglobus sp.]|nr:nuclear transport factor 2 family protein [Halioglobus sp.]
MTTGSVPTAAEVADRLAIQEVLASHSRGLDRLDPATLADCYWPEAEVDYGAYKGPAAPFVELVIGALDGQYELTRHGLGNVLIALAGDSARSETCVSAGHLLRGAQEELHFYGRYLDRLERRDGVWKLLHRRVVMEWCKRVPVVDERDSEAFRDLTKGAHHPGDPLYPFLQQDV